MKNQKNITSPIKQALFFSFILGLVSFNYAQTYHNNWINYNQQYYKFKIAETGIYRIDSATLANSGIPLNSINPQNFQLFSRGEELPIHIEGEGDGVNHLL